MWTAALDTGTVDAFGAARRQEAGQKRGDAVSLATVNKDLRHLRAALGVAQEWGFLEQLPLFRMEKAAGFVYLACAGGLYKVGHSADPAGRRGGRGGRGRGRGGQGQG